MGGHFLLVASRVVVYFPPESVSCYAANIFSFWMIACWLPIFDILFLFVDRDTYVKEMSGETKNDRNDRGLLFR